MNLQKALVPVDDSPYMSEIISEPVLFAKKDRMHVDISLCHE